MHDEATDKYKNAVVHRPRTRLTESIAKIKRRQGGMVCGPHLATNIVHILQYYPLLIAVKLKVSTSIRQRP